MPVFVGNALLFLRGAVSAWPHTCCWGMLTEHLRGCCPLCTTIHLLSRFLSCVFTQACVCSSPTAQWAARNVQRDQRFHSLAVACMAPGCQWAVPQSFQLKTPYAGDRRVCCEVCRPDPALHGSNVLGHGISNKLNV